MDNKVVFLEVQKPTQWWLLLIDEKTNFKI